MAEDFNDNEQMRAFVAMQAYQQHQHEQAVERMNAHAEAMNTTFARFIETIPAEQLPTMRSLILACTSESAANLVAGMITGRMIYAEGLTWDGKSLDEEAAKLAVEEADKPMIEEPIKVNDINDPAIQKAARMSDAELRQLYPVEDLTDYDQCPRCMRPLHSAEERADWDSDGFCETCRQYAMDKWGLEEDGSLNLRCANCKLPSASVADRALREPKVDGCTTCQRKAAHGF